MGDANSKRESSKEESKGKPVIGPVLVKSWLLVEYLRKEGNRNFHRLILEAWCGVELEVDHLVTRQFGLKCDYHDKKVEFLVNSTFEQKLQFLKKVKAVSTEEFKLIHAFQERRNTFFHALGPAKRATLSKEERLHIMDEAVAVTKLCIDLVHRQNA